MFTNKRQQRSTPLLLIFCRLHLDAVIIGASSTKQLIQNLKSTKNGPLHEGEFYTFYNVRDCFFNQSPVPDRPISVNPELKFCSTFCIYLPMLSFLFFEVKAQRYFVSSSYIFLDKKTLLKIWRNPGLKLTIFLRNRAQTSSNLSHLSQERNLVLRFLSWTRLTRPLFSHSPPRKILLFMKTHLRPERKTSALEKVVPFSALCDFPLHFNSLLFYCTLQMLSKYMKRLGKKQKETLCCIFAEMGAEGLLSVLAFQR